MISSGTAGHSWPLGATVVDGGINFSLVSPSATGVELLLFDQEDDARMTASTTRQTAKTIATEQTTTEAGTAGWKALPMIRAWRSSETGK